jgi:hypothetical protein
VRSATSVTPGIDDCRIEDCPTNRRLTRRRADTRSLRDILLILNDIPASFRPHLLLSDATAIQVSIREQAIAGRWSTRALKIDMAMHPHMSQIRKEIPASLVRDV